LAAGGHGEFPKIQSVRIIVAAAETDKRSLIKSFWNWFPYTDKRPRCFAFAILRESGVPQLFAAFRHEEGRLAFALLSKSGFQPQKH
jgi:hypothetical protein